ncbi:LysM peptidoglycan-binding domain-containing protein [Bacillus sp. LL01]|uniref:LysM peptidoglycan-binding domain-containing protein n=1 Tax=Bacillus sp. LL01 TaxID=1665556 RepID=UPI00069EC9E2|nr:LysM peptidoglycan-binding domain-containing protein [Bacillus sp. LL01]
MNNNKGLDQADGLREEVQKETNRLPSRSELHAQKRSTKTKWKMNFPFVRLIGVMFLLIPISILAIHFNNKDSNFLDKIFTPPVKNVEPISMPRNVSADTVENKDNDEGVSDVEQISTKEVAKEKDTTEISEEASGPGKPTEEEANVSEETSTSDTSSESEPVEEPVEEQQSDVEYIEHIVQESETLYRISMKYFSSREGERIISNHNNLVNDQVMVGQKLVIPVNR